MKELSSETSADPIDELIVKPANERLTTATQLASNSDDDDEEEEEENTIRLSDGEVSSLSVPYAVQQESTSELGEIQEENEEDLQGAPKGVVLYDPRDKGNEQQQLIAKLLRAPRYFEVAAEEETVRCYRCGQGGHLGRECPNRYNDIKPCTLCAKLGHTDKDCPNRICFKCGEVGHIVKQCKRGRQQNGIFSQVCIRCGRYECSASGRHDYYRYNGVCDHEYQERDMNKVLCLHCGNLHNTFCCAAAPKEALTPSCASCGAAGHWIEDCPLPLPPHLAAEKMGGKDQKSLIELEETLRQSYGEPARKRQRYNYNRDDDYSNRNKSYRGRGGGGGGGRGGGRRGQKHWQGRGGGARQVWHKHLK
eukprot:TRINITY_DN4567_c0_g1_i1.p2 TRINITY_DN4567_c0_g1~~TRINITY_DN4567_c0_g1_i1.p2  ORF type:complete len:364 (+),score=62.97 TRINITY_DN4567_c0_g1_i1:225-1316(+)